MKNIVIVGGGTAGWLTSIYIKKRYKEYTVTLIESSKIGILGAGEGGTPHIKSIIVNYFGFDELEFITQVNATKKYGISFNNWNRDVNHSYVHGFGINALESENYSYHFDARLFAEYLKTKSKDLGIIHLDKEIKNFGMVDSKVSKVIFTDETNCNVDFLFDCSGFHRLVIGKLYNTKWKSYMDELIVNSAVPFFIKSPNEVDKQKTIAEAVKYGWMWRIPLQNRWGCGYVYNDKFADEQTIKNEILKRFGEEDITINKKIKFDAGCYENVWVQNCIAIGLASGFLEPLEATSIMTVIIQLYKLPDNLFDYSKQNEYNKIVESINFQNMIFIRHHYNCSRDDTQFWKLYKNKKLPNELNLIYKNFKKNDDADLSYIFDIKKKNIIFGDDSYKVIYTNNFIKNTTTLI